MRLFVPVRRGAQNESLRYALRTWEAWHPDVVPTLFGGRPSWYVGDHVAVQQVPGPAHQWKRGGNFDKQLRAMAALGDEPFFYSHDDIFLEASLSPRTTFCRGMDIDTYLERWKGRPRLSTYVRMFVEGMESQRRIIRELGITTQHNADGHFPHWIDPVNLRELLTLLDEDFPTHPVGHWRMIYGALWPGKVVRMSDPKVMGHAEQPKTGLPFVSTEPRSWKGVAGTQVREAYSQKSPWEAL